VAQCNHAVPDGIETFTGSSFSVHNSLLGKR
jgi:hypothetical protein